MDSHPSHLNPATAAANDLDSISAANSSDNATAATPADNEDYGDDVNDNFPPNYSSSISTFTAACLDNAPRSSKLSKVDSGAVKVEVPDSVKDGAYSGCSALAGLTAASGLTMKEDSVKSIFTENIQTSGAYSPREEGLKREEETGKLRFLCLSNDGVDEHMKPVMVIRRSTVVGGITYRPYKRSENNVKESGYRCITFEMFVADSRRMLKTHAPIIPQKQYIINVQPGWRHISRVRQICKLVFHFSSKAQAIVQSDPKMRP